MDSLFRKLLGSELDKVQGGLSAFLDSPGAAEGNLTVRHHPGKSARFFIRLLRLPKEGTDMPTRLDVSIDDESEYWRRQIGQSRLKSRHRIREGKLEEQMWPFSFLYDVELKGGALTYTQTEVRLLGMKLPSTFSPIVGGEVIGRGDGWWMRISVSCPRCGPICVYEGTMVAR